MKKSAHIHKTVIDGTQKVKPTTEDEDTTHTIIVQLNNEPVIPANTQKIEFSSSKTSFFFQISEKKHKKSTSD